MATVTYRTTLENGQKSFQATSADLAGKISALESNIKSLNEMAARPFADIKDQLKLLNQEMLAYYKNGLPTVVAASEAGQKAIAEMQGQITYLTQQPALTNAVIEHLNRVGDVDVQAIIGKEKERDTAKTELEGNIRALNEALVKIEGLKKPFTAALDNALRVQGDGEGTNYRMDSVWALGSYAYLNKALLVQESAPKAVEKLVEVK